MPKITKEQIDAFLAGSDPMEKIIKIECGYDDDRVYIIYYNEKGEKRIKREDFHPFVWAKRTTAQKLYGGDRKKLKKRMDEAGIECVGLRVNRDDGTIPERMENGYRVMFRAKEKMCYNKFLKFFEDAGVPIYGKKGAPEPNVKPYIAVSPNEQFMIATGKRMFKGYDDYDDLLRLEFDLETEGLDPHIHAISQIGIRTNKGYEKIITIVGEGEEKRRNEWRALCEFMHIIKELKADIITGHNTENFDWYFIDERLKLYGSDLYQFTKDTFPNGIYKKKKQAVLKLGGEMEYYYPTVMWGTNMTDSLFAVRRAMAIDSNIKSANLKYITKFSKLVKPNRVYVPGKIINSTWEDMTPSYLFNDKNGEWFKFTSKVTEKTFTDTDGAAIAKYTVSEDGKTVTDNETGAVLTFVTGRYIVERYLLDDLYETDKVELQYNLPNFLVCKMLPVSFERQCTMGTAAVWKSLMMAWSYEHGLAIPDSVPQSRFTGGLSRLLSVGYVDRVVKLDYNSLYPSIILTFGIRTPIDLMDVMSSLLEYMLTQREYYKELKGKHGKEADKLNKKLEEEINNLTNELILQIKSQVEHEKSLKIRNDKLQLPLKITSNGFFGSYGAGGIVFPWSDIECAEMTTCIGRQMLRLMIGHFNKLGYKPIVGDSFTSDTPIFIKYDNGGYVDIRPISELIDEKNIERDALGREYDYSKKPYKVLCRSGWVEPSYIYRHATDKKIMSISDGVSLVDVTEDHSLYDKQRVKIKPSEIKRGTELEYVSYDAIRYNSDVVLSERQADSYVRAYNSGVMKALPVRLLNASVENKRIFLSRIRRRSDETKTMQAGIMFLKNTTNNN